LLKFKAYDWIAMRLSSDFESFKTIFEIYRGISWYYYALIAEPEQFWIYKLPTFIVLSDSKYKQLP
jgi:hypothetical protein